MAPPGRGRAQLASTHPLLPLLRDPLRGVDSVTQIHDSRRVILNPRSRGSGRKDRWLIRGCVSRGVLRETPYASPAHLRNKIDHGQVEREKETERDREKAERDV